MLPLPLSAQNVRQERNAGVLANPASVTTSGRDTPRDLSRFGNSVSAWAPKRVGVGNEKVTRLMRYRDASLIVSLPVWAKKIVVG